MNKYLIPICRDFSPYIMSISARSMEEAESKLMNQLSRDWDLDVPTDWDDFCEIAFESGYFIGTFSDIEEF